jgi:MarR family transcriptional regulator, lower aerobic nicotinate degradation pathway regulator
MDTSILQNAQELLSLLERYLHEKEAQDEPWLTDFASWLSFIRSDEQNEGEDKHNGAEYIDVMIGMQLISTSNKVRTRLNTFIADSPFSSFLDYQFLFVLKEHGRMTKSELIYAHHMEISSGIEVVKRLLKQNWIYEEPNPDDRRSKLITVTREGEELLSRYSASAREIYTSFSRDLDYPRKRAVLQLLNLLNASGR